jgi:ATP-binding protein involved in chromosome partitioning
LGQIPLVQGIREAGDDGKPAILQADDPITGEAFMQVAQQVVRQVGLRNEMLAQTKIVEMKN